jgi:hypothetical protein
MQISRKRLEIQTQNISKALVGIAVDRLTTVTSFQVKRLRYHPLLSADECEHLHADNVSDVLQRSRSLSSI